jgi:hypothetical protein
LSEARPADGLKAAEMLAKMCGWNELERVNVQSVEVKVDAGLIAQLSQGYAEMSVLRGGAKWGSLKGLGGRHPRPVCSESSPSGVL